MSGVYKQEMFEPGLQASYCFWRIPVIFSWLQSLKSVPTFTVNWLELSLFVK